MIRVLIFCAVLYGKRFDSNAKHGSVSIDQRGETLGVDPEICEQVKESYFRGDWMRGLC